MIIHVVTRIFSVFFGGGWGMAVLRRTVDLTKNTHTDVLRI